MRFGSISFVKLHKTEALKLAEVLPKVQIIKKLKKTLKKGLTKWDESGIIYKLSRRAVARSLKIEQQTKKYKLGYRRKKVTVKEGLCEEVGQRF